MCKEFGDITTLGHDDSFTGIKMWDNVWGAWLRHQIDSDIYYYIKNACTQSDNNYKIIDPTLEKFVGVYPIDTSKCIDWQEEFCRLLSSWINDHSPYSNIFLHALSNDDPLRTKYINYKIKYNEFTDVMCNTADYTSGYVQEKNRSTKILKYIKNELRKYFEINITDAEFEKTNWYKYYVKKKECNDQLYLVITNSIAAHIGMSSYAPKKNGTNVRVWGSCQTIEHNYDGYARCLPSNLTDKNSVICYITNGSKVLFQDGGNLLRDEYQHQAMICRWMLRVYEVTKGTFKKQRIVALDRAYPNDAYAIPVINKIIEIANENNILISLYKEYNGSQNKTYNELEEKLNTDCVLSAQSIHPIMYATDSDDDEQQFFGYYSDQGTGSRPDDIIDECKCLYINNATLYEPITDLISEAYKPVDEIEQEETTIDTAQVYNDVVNNPDTVEPIPQIPNGRPVVEAHAINTFDIFDHAFAVYPVFDDLIHLPNNAALISHDYRPDIFGGAAE